MQARNRKTGSPIIMTRERLYGTSKLDTDSFSREEGGRISYVFDSDGTTVDWDSGETVGFIDADGLLLDLDEIELIETADAAGPSTAEGADTDPEGGRA